MNISLVKTLMVSLMLTASSQASATDPSLNGNWRATTEDCLSGTANTGLQKIVVTDRQIVITLVTGDQTKSLACEISTRKQKGRLVLAKAICDGGDRKMKLMLGAVIANEAARFDLSLSGVPTFRSVLRQCEAE
jgi:hypothetical protein